MKENQKEKFLEVYLPNSENNNSLISISQNNSNLFIIHPIYKKQSNKNLNDKHISNELINYYFFSENYI